MILNFINRFTEEQVIGLNISDFSAEAVILEKNYKTWKVYSFARFRLSPGIVENGQIIQADKLKEELKKLFALGKPHPMKASSVFLSIPDSQVFARVLSLPKSLRHKDLLLAASNKADEFIPEEKEKLIATFKILPVNNGQVEIFYAAAKKELVAAWGHFFESMGIDVIGVTMESVSSLAGLADSVKQDIGLLLDIGARTSIASIFDQDGIKDSIVIPIAGNNLTDAIASKLNISHVAAEEKKHTIGMDSSIDQGEIMWILQGQLQPMADELKKFITFYEENTGKKVKNLFLIGGTAQTKGIDKYFGGNLNLNISSPETIVDYSKFKLADYLQAVKYVNAFGLARLAQEKKIDINFYQTLRVDLQQRVDLTNISLWLRTILNIFQSIPKMAKSWVAWLIFVLFCVAGFLIWRPDFIIKHFVVSQKTFEQEIILDTVTQGQDNWLPAIVINQAVFVKQNYRDLSYEEAVQKLKTEAQNLALDKAKNTLKSQQFLVESVVEEQILSLVPTSENFQAGSGLSLKANYIFWALNKQEVKSFILSHVSATEASKYSAWQIAEQKFLLLSSNMTVDNKLDFFSLQAKLILRKP